MSTLTQETYELPTSNPQQFFLLSGLKQDAKKLRGGVFRGGSRNFCTLVRIFVREYEAGGILVAQPDLLSQLLRSVNSIHV